MFIKMSNYTITENSIEISNKESFFKYFGMIISVRALLKSIRKPFGCFFFWGGGGFDNAPTKLLPPTCDKNESFYFEITK